MTRHPRPADVFFIVEVSRSTLSFDRSPLSDFNKQRWALLMVHRMAVDPTAAS